MDTKVADHMIGALVDGRYRVRARVASGGMATVYTAVDERLERTVALKIIHPAQATDPRFVDRFTREAKTIARLTHPNVVAVYDQGNHDGLPYLIMEYVRGRTLRDMLADARRLDPVEALAILEQMLAAIAAAHRAGVVHRDVKPENVLVAESPGGVSLLDAVVKVADFGLARAVEASAEDGDGQLLATVAYVAPELVTDGYADPRTDVYSVGIVLFEMLTGRVPYDGGKPVEVAWRHVDQDVPPPSKFVPDLPPELDALVIRATRREPDARPTDAGAMLAEVQVARDRMDSQASLRGGTLAQPTVPVDTIPRRAPAGRSGAAGDRPTWSRLPGTAPADRASSGPSTSGPSTSGPSTSGPSTSRSSTSGSSTGRRRAPDGARAGRGSSSRGLMSAGPGGLTARSSAMLWFSQVMSRPNGRRTFYVTLGVLSLIVMLTGWWFGFGRYTAAPSLLGQTQAQAAQTAQRLGFTIRYDAGAFEEKIPKNTVIGQQPGPSARVVRGGVIVLSLSLGPERYPVPDERGKAYATAVSDLTSVKMVPKRADAYDDNVPSGFVVSTSPKAGTVEPPNTQIVVTVSKGKAPITVPNVVGQDFTTASQQLTALGLVVAQTQKSSTTQPVGLVIAQSIDVDAGAERGQTIILTVSTGPPQATVPDVTNQGLTFDQAAAILKKAGFIAVKMFDYPGGQVRNEQPAGGTVEPVGTQVQLWVYP